MQLRYFAIQSQRKSLDMDLKNHELSYWIYWARINFIVCIGLELEKLLNQLTGLGLIL